MRQPLTPCLALGAALVSIAALAQPSPPPDAQMPSGSSRGQLLYEAHCIQCHATQIHWRQSRAARDWPSLRVQVENWQRRSGQQWTDEDIDAVARFLNETIYHYPETKQRG